MFGIAWLGKFKPKVLANPNNSLDHESWWQKSHDFAESFFTHITYSGHSTQIVLSDKWCVDPGPLPCPNRSCSAPQFFLSLSKRSADKITSLVNLLLWTVQSDLWCGARDRSKLLSSRGMIINVRLKQFMSHIAAYLVWMLVYTREVTEHGRNLDLDTNDCTLRFRIHWMQVNCNIKSDITDTDMTLPQKY